MLNGLIFETIGGSTHFHTFGMSTGRHGILLFEAIFIMFRFSRQTYSRMRGGQANVEWIHSRNRVEKILSCGCYEYLTDSGHCRHAGYCSGRDLWLPEIWVDCCFAPFRWLPVSEMKCRKWLKGQTEDNTMDLIMKLWILCLEDQDLSSGSL